MKKPLFTIALLLFMSAAVTACTDNKGYTPPGGQHQNGGHGGGGHSH